MGWSVHIKSQGGQSAHPFGKYITPFPLPGKQVVRCSISASWVTGFLAEFIAEMAKQRISPSGINWDWLMGDILIGDTSPAERQLPSKQFVKTQPLVTNTHTHPSKHTHTHTHPSHDSPIPCAANTINPQPWNVLLPQPRALRWKDLHRTAEASAASTKKTCL